MRRRWVYLMALVGIVAVAGTGRSFAVFDGDVTPLWIEVNVADEAQPEEFTVAVGDLIEFAPWAQGRGERFDLLMPSLLDSSRARKPDLSPPSRDIVLRIQGENGVLGEMSVTRHASFQDGKLEVQHEGLNGRSVKATKAGKVTVEVTTHRGGTHKEIREFKITVVAKREVPTKV
jgi:hypothetical protein